MLCADNSFQVMPFFVKKTPRGTAHHYDITTDLLLDAAAQLLIHHQKGTTNQGVLFQANKSSKKTGTESSDRLSTDSVVLSLRTVAIFYD
jgi:hypothetical protein